MKTRINTDFTSNFQREFREGQLIAPVFNHSAWNIISWVVGIVLMCIPGVGWALAIIWAAVTTIVNLVWSNNDNVRAARDARVARLYLASLMRNANGGLGVENNGQLVNTRQSNDPIRVIYGKVKTGGTWIFNKMSRVNSQMMNTIITWGEGEISGIGTGLDCFPIFSGTTTLNDLRLSGEFVYAGCSCDAACYGYTPCSCDMVCHVYA